MHVVEVIVLRIKPRTEDGKAVSVEPEAVTVTMLAVTILVKSDTEAVLAVTVLVALEVRKHEQALLI